MNAGKDATNPVPLTVRILGRDYQVNCPEGERESLLASAEYLSKRMHNIQKKGKTPGVERIAVMAALNMARDLLEHEYRKRHAPFDKEACKRLSQLQRTIETALDQSGAVNRE